MMAMASGRHYHKEPGRRPGVAALPCTGAATRVRGGGSPGSTSETVEVDRKTVTPSVDHRGIPIALPGHVRHVPVEDAQVPLELALGQSRAGRPAPAVLLPPLAQPGCDPLPSLGEELGRPLEQRILGLEDPVLREESGDLQLRALERKDVI